jgi:serine/threonine protein kinase/tetratricopeptide (TPR) repeat protein
VEDHKANDDNTRSFVPITKGTTISQYKIIEKIGAGGMGEVYTAEDTKLSRKVAIKFLPLHMLSIEETKIRFVREAQTIAKLNHPNIVSIHDVSEFNGRPYYVMELVEGESLHGFAHKKPLPFDTIVDYAIQICQGLGEAHRAGIVHRDIKAANIVIDGKGRIRLLDFGLAAMAGDDRLTRTGSTLGTTSYMSPEQVSGRDVDHRSDLFSLGIVLYELITGRTPFKRDSEGATLKAIIEDNPEPLTRYKSDVPDKLQDIVMQLLEKDKELRYQSAEGIIADLKRLLYDSAQTGYSRIIPPKSSKKKTVVGIMGISAIAVAFVLYYTLGKIGEKPSNDGRIPMIAVLPFDNLGDAEDEYFADGITDEITSRLAGISGLGVISRTSSMVYKNSDKKLGEIGKELGVDYILEGTVRWSKVGDKPRVRITPQLVRVSDDRHMWADNYERELMEVFAVQADIGRKIVDQLGITLVQKDINDLESRPTDNAEAYALYLKALSMKARSYMNYWTESRVMEMAIDSAVVLDTNFALGFALQSEIYSWKAISSQSEADGLKARSAAERALQLVPGLSQGYIALGYYYNLVEENYEQALEEFNKAGSDTHNNADLLAAIALVQMRQGIFYESVKNLRRAADLDPLNPQMHYSLAECLWITQSFTDAITSFDRAIALEPASSHFWQRKVELIASWTGNRDRQVQVTREALHHCDSVDFLSSVPFLMDYMPDIEWEKIMEEFRKSNSYPEIRGSGRVTEDIYYPALIELNYFLGDSVLMRTYADSFRIVSAKKLSENPDDFHSATNLGYAFMLLGDCEKAIEYAQLGLDMMGVDNCHW